MILSISAQASMFLRLAAAGAAAGALFDLFRAARRVVPHPNALTHAEDALWVLLVLAATLWLLFTRNGGDMRGYVLLGLALGMVLYFAAVSPVVLRVFVWLLGMLKRVLFAFLRLATLPIRVLRRVLHVPYAKCRVFAKNAYFP